MPQGCVANALANRHNNEAFTYKSIGNRLSALWHGRHMKRMLTLNNSDLVQFPLEFGRGSQVELLSEARSHVSDPLCAQVAAWIVRSVAMRDDIVPFKASVSFVYEFTGLGVCATS